MVVLVPNELIEAKDTSCFRMCAENETSCGFFKGCEQKHEAGGRRRGGGVVEGGKRGGRWGRGPSHLLGRSEKPFALTSNYCLRFPESWIRRCLVGCCFDCLPLRFDAAGRSSSAHGSTRPEQAISRLHHHLPPPPPAPNIKLKRNHGLLCVGTLDKVLSCCVASTSPGKMEYAVS